MGGRTAGNNRIRYGDQIQSKLHELLLSTETEYSAPNANATSSANVQIPKERQGHDPLPHLLLIFSSIAVPPLSMKLRI